MVNTQIMRFKNPVSTIKAVSILGVHKYTLWKWGEKGLIRMERDLNGARIFDGDELKTLAPKIPKDRFRGFTIFPAKSK